MSLERCVHSGHCLHRDDGALFVRHSANPRGLVAVACCWCDKRAELEAYSRGTAPPAESSFTVRECGPFQPGSKSAETIAAASDEELVEAMLVARDSEADAMRGDDDDERTLMRSEADTAKAAVLARLATLRREKAAPKFEAETVANATSTVIP